MIHKLNITSHEFWYALIPWYQISKTTSDKITVSLHHLSLLTHTLAQLHLPFHSMHTMPLLLHSLTHSHTHTHTHSKCYHCTHIIHLKLIRK